MQKGYLFSWVFCHCYASQMDCFQYERTDTYGLFSVTLLNGVNALC